MTPPEVVDSDQSRRQQSLRAGRQLPASKAPGVRRAGERPLLKALGPAAGREVARLSRLEEVAAPSTTPSSSVLGQATRSTAPQVPREGEGIGFGNCWHSDRGLEPRGAPRPPRRCAWELLSGYLFTLPFLALSRVPRRPVLASFLRASPTASADVRSRWPSRLWVGELRHGFTDDTSSRQLHRRISCRWCPADHGVDFRGGRP